MQFLADFGIPHNYKNDVIEDHSLMPTLLPFENSFIFRRVILGMFKHYPLEHQSFVHIRHQSFVHIRLLLSVRKSGEPLLKILLQREKILQGKNEHQSFLSPLISRRSYLELKKRKKKKRSLQLGENKSVRKSGEPQLKILLHWEKDCTRKK